MEERAREGRRGVERGREGKERGCDGKRGEGKGVDWCEEGAWKGSGEKGASNQAPPALFTHLPSSLIKHSSSAYVKHS